MIYCVKSHVQLLEVGVVLPQLLVGWVEAICAKISMQIFHCVNSHYQMCLHARGAVVPTVCPWLCANSVCTFGGGYAQEMHKSLSSYLVKEEKRHWMSAWQHHSFLSGLVLSVCQICSACPSLCFPIPFLPLFCFCNPFHARHEKVIQVQDNVFFG